MPPSDQEFAQINVELPVGTDLGTTERVVREIETTVSTLPEVESMGAWGGVSDASQQDVAFGSAQAGINNAQVFIKLAPKQDRDRSSMRIVDDLRGRMPDIEGARYDFPDMNSGMFGSEAPIEINVFGRDLGTLKRLAARIVDGIDDIEGIRDVDSSMRQGTPELSIDIDREKAGGFGLTVGQVASEVQAAMLGTVATAYRKKGEEFEVRVRYAPRFRSTVADIRNITLKTPMGSHVRLMDVAEVARGTGPVRIDRANQMRRAIVTANVMDRDLMGVVGDIEEAIAPLERREFPQGYFTEITGQFEQMQDFFGYLGLALALAVLLVYMVMAAQFESFAQPLIVMFTLPLALIGVFLLLFATGNRFNVPSGMGLVMLAGIVVNNGIILIDYVNQLRRRGLDVTEALVEGAKTRLRPIFITSFTTIFGMMPMVLDRGEGAEMRSPMALTVIGGLMTSMVLTLVVIPVVYSLFESLSRRVLGRSSVVQSAPVMHGPQEE
jgi:HAE1 family hydrophobic/amphiphilic exporter-1